MPKGEFAVIHIMGSDYNTETFFGRLPEAIGSQFSANELARFFATAGADPEWDVPYGMTYNALAAMVTQAYLAATPTTIEEVAAACVTLRKWAMLQPNAMFNSKELSVEQVLSSRMVADLLTSLMCNVLADGGSAYVMTTAEKARRVSPRPVYVLSDASVYSHRSITSANVRDFSEIMSFGPVVDRAYERAGLGPDTSGLPSPGRPGSSSHPASAIRAAPTRSRPTARRWGWAS
ncbi:MAG TPA: hypothetical protein VMU39_10435 [Solirubrobacteraceae bacterium]|nr:hypothetical protein [Solirubrobacteraceae bacterium]